MTTNKNLELIDMHRAGAKQVLDLCRNIRVLFEKAAKAEAKRCEYVTAATQHLKKLYLGCRSQKIFLALVQEHCGVKRSRAYELLMIAKGDKTIAQVRSETASRVAAHQAKLKPSVTNGRHKPSSSRAVAVIDQDDQNDDALDGTPAGVAVTPAAVTPAVDRIYELERENLALRSEVEDLRRQLEAYRSPVRCEYVEDDGGRAAAGYGEASGACVARAITIATGKPYAEVFEELKARHYSYVKRLPRDHYERRTRTEPVDNGCSEKIYGPYLKSFDWEYTRIRER